MFLLLYSCSQPQANHRKDIDMEAFSALKTPSYSLSPAQIRECISELIRNDRDSTTADHRTRRYYREGGRLVWIDRLGTDSRADTLLTALRSVEEIGFSEQSFWVAEIEDDLSKLRSLDFQDNSLLQIAARLEYRLTKAYLRYVIGQYFGFVNPNYIFNRLDALKKDSTGRTLSYRLLFDLKVPRPDSAFVSQALEKASCADSLSFFLQAVLPTDSLYLRLRTELSKTNFSTARKRLLCNMERRRWRETLRPEDCRKYVVVNIPAYQLWAYSEDTVINMRIGCGTQKTKTPILTSYISHMNVNPDWRIPMSIIKSDIARHAGDPSYFAKRRYYITNRKTGERISPTMISSTQLTSGAYSVAQEGGPGNSLGRIIFRFPNNFDVFLHDTSTRGFFDRDDRSVSHGCVRVQKPFDLAAFLLGKDVEEWTLDKIRISMDLPPASDRGRDYVKDETASRRLVSWLGVTPRVPIFLTYYTLFPEPDGTLRSYPDVYGYDSVIMHRIKPFLP